MPTIGGTMMTALGLIDQGRSRRRLRQAGRATPLEQELYDTRRRATAQQQPQQPRG